MSFIQEIKEIENERKEKENDVINEIVNYFNEKFNDVKYEEYLKKRIKEEINNSKKHLTLNIEFWNYHSGCSETNFSCGGIKFKLDYGKYDYKGIELYDIQHKVCDKLSVLLCDKLEELGLTIVSKTRHDNEYRFGYHNEKIII